MSHIVTGEFKKLIQSVCRFGSIGSFTGSELVNFIGRDNILSASSLGVVLAKARVPAAGEIPLIAVDERLVQNFAAICSSSSKVAIEVGEKEIVFKSGKKQATAPFRAGQQHKLPGKEALEKAVKLKLTPSLAKHVGYLANVAFADSCRPELNCVMLAGDGRAMAINQKLVAVFTCSKNGSKTAVPIPLAKALEEGMTIYAGEHETVLKDSLSYYVMPSPVAAQGNFPVAAIEKYGQMAGSRVFICPGSILATAFQECNSVLGSLSNVEVAVKLTTVAQRIELSSQNGTAKFSRRFPGKVITDNTEIVLPLDEAMKIRPFLEDQEKIELSLTENGGCFIKIGSTGWAMFPAWKKGK